MAKIITVTANTAIDFFIEVEGLVSLDNIIATNSSEFACGKGINVAKGVASLEREATCLGFVGRQSFSYFNDVESKFLRTEFTPVEGKTRTNITLSDCAYHKETHIRTSGFNVTVEDCNRLIETIYHEASAGDLVVLSGSLPPGAPVNLYRTVIENCHKKSVIPFLDTSGKCLSAALKAKPYLIKPNQAELEEIIGGTLPDERAIVAAARTIIDQGVEWVIVSRAEKGIVAVGEDVAFSARINFKLQNAQSKIGCGDALVAGLAVATLDGYGLDHTLRLGVACGTANLFSIEPGRFDNRKVTEIFKRIDVRSI